MAIMNQFAADPNQKPKQSGAVRPQTGTGIQGRPPAQSGSSSGPIADPAEMKKRLAALPGLSDMDRRRLDEAASRGMGAIKDTVRGRPFEMDVQQALNAATGAAQNKMGGSRPAWTNGFNPAVAAGLEQSFSGGSAPGPQPEMPPPGSQAGTAQNQGQSPPFNPGGNPGGYNEPAPGTGHKIFRPGDYPTDRLRAMMDPATRAQYDAALRGMKDGTGDKRALTRQYAERLGVDWGQLNVPSPGMSPSGGNGGYESPPFNPNAPAPTTTVPPQAPPIYNSPGNPNNPPIYYPPANPNNPPTQIPDIFLPF